MTPGQNGNFLNHIPSDDFSTIEKVKGVRRNRVFLSYKKRHLPFFTPRTISELLKPFDKTT